MEKIDQFYNMKIWTSLLILLSTVSSQSTKRPSKAPLSVTCEKNPGIFPNPDQPIKESKYFGKDKFCAGYSPMKMCFMCYNSYFSFEQNRCIEIQKSIPNCLFYCGQNTCTGCDFGYTYDFISQKCVKNQIEHCKLEIAGKCQVPFKFSIEIF